jgi:hypothetical protein
MLAAEGAELLHLKTLSGRLFILSLAVVAVLAFAALKLNDLSWHNSLLRKTADWKQPTVSSLPNT